MEEITYDRDPGPAATRKAKPCKVIQLLCGYNWPPQTVSRWTSTGGCLPRTMEGL